MGFVLTKHKTFFFDLNLDNGHTILQIMIVRFLKLIPIVPLYNTATTINHNFN